MQVTTDKALQEALKGEESLTHPSPRRSPGVVVAAKSAAWSPRLCVV